MDHLKIRGTIGFDVLNLIGLVGLRLRSQKTGGDETATTPVSVSSFWLEPWHRQG